MWSHNFCLLLWNVCFECFPLPSSRTNASAIFSFQFFFLLFSKADWILAKTFSEKLQERILVPASEVFIETSLIEQLLLCFCWTLCTLFKVPPLCINSVHVVHTFPVICWVQCSNLAETPTLVQVLLSHYRNGLHCAQHITCMTGREYKR